jgi:hypothetical protein
MAACHVPRVPAASTDERGSQRLTSLIAGVELVPELDLWLTEAPTEENGASIHLAREVHQTQAPVLELNPELLELLLESVDLSRDGLRVSLELFGPLARLTDARGRCHEIELEDLLAPQPVLANDILHDLANERERSIGLIDGEQRQELEVNGGKSYSGD